VRPSLLWTCATFLVAACGTTAVSPGQQVSDAAAAMAKVNTAQADVSFGPGATVQGFVLVSATGKVKRPSDSDTVGKVKAAGALIQPELISTGGKTYLRQAQFLPFQELDAAAAIDYPSAGRLLDADHGVTAALPKGRTPAAAGTESVGGHVCDKITATYAPADLNAALAPIKLTDDVKVTLWIDQSTKYVRRVRIAGHIFDPAANSFVDARLHDFNAPVTITAPG